MNGIYGFRPSYQRIPYEGSVNSLEGQDSLPSVLGPLSTDIGGIKLFMQAVIGQRPWLKDPLVLRKPWDEDGYRLVEHGGGKKLTFGILWNDGVVIPQPPIIRALEMTKEAIIAAGHDGTTWFYSISKPVAKSLVVIDWKPYKCDEIYAVTVRGKFSAVYTQFTYPSQIDIWGAAGNEDYAAVTSQTGEPILKSMEDSGTSETDIYIKETGISAFELFQIQKRRAALRKEHLDYWHSTRASTSTGRPVDAIISPVAPFPPPPHGNNKYVPIPPLTQPQHLHFIQVMPPTHSSGIRWTTRLAFSPLLK